MNLHFSQAITRAIRRLLVRVARKPRRPESNCPVDLRDPIGGAVRDAELLIAFAAQSCRKIDTEKTVNLIRTAAAIASARAAQQALTVEECAKFWAAYDALAVDMAPLSAQSIRTSLRINATPAARSILTHLGINAWFALIMFMVCVGLQVFWVTGKDLIERSELFEKNRVEAQGKLVDNVFAIGKTYLQIKSNECRMSNKSLDDSPCWGVPGAPLAHAKLDERRFAALQAELQLLHAQASEKVLQRREIRLQLDSTIARGKPVETLLERWYMRAKTVCGLPPMSLVCLGDDSALPDKSGTLKTSLLELRSHVGAVVSAGTQPLPVQGYLEDLEKTLTDGEKFQRMLVESRMIVANVGTYLIAMTMGVLGALTFILRSTSQQLREHTYLPVSISMTTVRICFGAIAGVFGSLLIPNGDPTLKSLPPLFIPFLFGYGIEILFSLMDKLVRNFTQGNAQATGK